MRKVQFAVVAMMLGIGSGAFAQESEFQNKMQEDLDFYKPQFVGKCKTSDAITFKFVGKLGANPRETRVSISCTQAVEAALYSCDTNATVVKALSKVKSVTCTLGSGPYSYKLNGASLTFTIDDKYDDHKDKANQKDALVAKIKKDLDK
jgi:hypothetical protein